MAKYGELEKMLDSLNLVNANLHQLSNNLREVVTLLEDARDPIAKQAKVQLEKQIGYLEGITF